MENTSSFTASALPFQREAHVYAPELFFKPAKIFYPNILRRLSPRPPTRPPLVPVTGAPILVSFAVNNASAPCRSHDSCLPMLLISNGKMRLSCHGNVRRRLLTLWLPARVISSYQQPLKMDEGLRREFTPE